MGAKLTLSDLEPYIKGTKFTGDIDKQPVECDPTALATFLGLVEADNYASTFLKFDNAKTFYNTLPDFEHHIPKEQMQEVFYAAKAGSYIKGCPSMCHYMIKEAWKEANGMPNLVPMILPAPLLKTFLKRGYLTEGLTLEKLISSLCKETYKPLSVTQPKVKHDVFTELYVRGQDMVAAVPNDIGDSLPDEDVLNIEVTRDGLATRGILLRTMCGRMGAINSTYDLRELI